MILKWENDLKFLNRKSDDKRWRNLEQYSEPGRAKFVSEQSIKKLMRELHESNEI